MAGNEKFTLIAGPCVIEDLDMLRTTAETLKGISERLNIDFTFKSSFDKANRSSLDSYRGPGLDEGLNMLNKIKKEFDLKVTSDIHTPDQAKPAAEVLDKLQIPAFLSRQTDLITAAAKTGKPTTVKKAQFMNPGEIKNVISKFRDSGGKDISIMERGTFFGYGNLVVDFRSVPMIKDMGVPYIFDATHSVQLPAGKGDSSSGERQYIPVLTRAQIAAGADGLFMETHPDINSAKSDKDSQFPLQEMEDFLKEMIGIYQFIHQN